MIYWDAIIIGLFFGILFFIIFTFVNIADKNKQHNDFEKSQLNEINDYEI